MATRVVVPMPLQMAQMVQCQTLQHSNMRVATKPRKVLVVRERESRSHSVVLVVVVRLMVLVVSVTPTRSVH